MKWLAGLPWKQKGLGSIPKESTYDFLTYVWNIIITDAPQYVWVFDILHNLLKDWAQKPVFNQQKKSDFEIK